VFLIDPPAYVTPEIVSFVRERLSVKDIPSSQESEVRSQK